MPITEKNGKWYWGEQGPYDTKEAAQRVAMAAYLSGYKKKTGVMPKKKPYRGKYIKDGKIFRKNEDPTEKSKRWLIDTVERSYPQITNLNILTNRTIAGGYIIFNCHNLTWRVELTRITWIAPFGSYVVCVVSDDKYGDTARYDKFLTKIDVIANQTFGVVPILEFAWELYQLDLAYPKFKFYGEYFTPINSPHNTFYDSYKFLKGATQINLTEWKRGVRFDDEEREEKTTLENEEVYNETSKMAKEKLELVRELYHQIFGGYLR